MRNLVSLDYKMENKEVRLLCDSDTPLSYVKDALIKFMAHVDSIEEAAKQANPETESAESAPEVVGDEPQPSE